MSQGNVSTEQLNILVRKYLDYETIPDHRDYIEKLVQQNDLKQLHTLVGKRLTFGTAGIRGSMGPGFGQMNDLVIIQTSQGLASYLLHLDGKLLQKQGVIIGHDARHNSARFSRLACLAFLQKDIPVYYCDRIVPTPLVAFGVKHYSCRAGIVVTASHNPKNDNGYKVYFSNGAQILSPHDKGIQEHIMRDDNQKPWAMAWQQEKLDNSHPSSSKTPKNWDELLNRIQVDLCKAYFAYIENLVRGYRTRNKSSNICITYTSMHGVGHTYLNRALDIAGFEEAFPVEAQKKPDPEFSTVKFPNPEEPGALDLAFETAKHANSNLIIACDPDADRCAGAICDPETNYKRILNGNELGALLGWWIWHSYLNSTDSGNCFEDYAHNENEGSSKGPSSPEKRKISDCCMISTAVSSKFLQSMAKVEGFSFHETLTGFKYMGNLADELIREQGKHVLFAYEEAIGYMVNSVILDKDGIAAAVQLAQCAAYVDSVYSRTLDQQLDWLYSRYGFHYSVNSYYFCSEQQVIGEIFHNIQRDYPKSFGADFPVTRVRDLNLGYDSSAPNKRASLPSSSSTFMLTFFVAQDITFTIRTSGTEPKIKYYSEIVTKLPDLESTAVLETSNLNDPQQIHAKSEARDRLHRLVHDAIELCIRPDHYNLEAAD